MSNIGRCRISMQQQDGKHQGESHTCNGVRQLFKSIVTKYHFFLFFTNSAQNYKKKQIFQKYCVILYRLREILRWILAE